MDFTRTVGPSRLVRVSDRLPRQPGSDPRSPRDVTLAFLSFYVGSCSHAPSGSGDPLTIPLHQIESGRLLIFAFFMISDRRQRRIHDAGGFSLR